MLYIGNFDKSASKFRSHNDGRGTVWPIVELPFYTDRHMNEPGPTSLGNLETSQCFFEGA